MRLISLFLIIFVLWLFGAAECLEQLNEYKPDDLRCKSLGNASSFFVGDKEYSHNMALVRNHSWEVECFRPVSDHHAQKVLSDGFCLPSWIIIGAGKSGTSALWQFLCGDRETHACKNKEFHFQTDSIRALKSMGNTPGTASGNSCLFLPFDLRSYLLESTCVKFIYILRNPIDWVYAAWHFWCLPKFDGPNCVGAGRVARIEKEAMPRTPENFQKVLEDYCVPTAAEQEQEKLSGRLKKTRFTSMRCPLSWPWTMWNDAIEFKSKLGTDRFIVLRTEDLHEYPEVTMFHLYKFLGIPRRAVFGDQEFEGRYRQAWNVGARPGIGNLSSAESALGESYLPMLPESTRLLVHLIDYHEMMNPLLQELSLHRKQYDDERIW